MSDEWPAWATQPIEIVEHDPRWESRAAQLAHDLERRLAPWLDGTVQHVGSTSVPGLAAKPVIDLLAPVRSLTDSAAATEALAPTGWVLVPPELDQRPWRRTYVLPDGDRREAHLHLVESTHPRCREMIRFRDRLRRRPDLAGQYADLKRTAAEAYGQDREAYTEAKAAFVRAVVEEAEV